MAINESRSERTGAVFLDKDGTVIDNIPFNVDLRKITFAPGAIKGLKRLHEAGFPLIIVSNQAGVALGHFPANAVLKVKRHIHGMLNDIGVRLRGFFFCPHHPQGTVAHLSRRCACRKPEPGLLFRAAGRLAIDLTLSWMVGDILDDIEAGKRAGLKTILIDNGNETEWILSPMREPDYRVTDFNQAAEIIIRQQAILAETTHQY